LGPRQQDYYYKHVFHRTGYYGALGIMCTALLGKAHMNTPGHPIQKTG
jgi:hypothetical protein